MPASAKPYATWRLSSRRIDDRPSCDRQIDQLSIVQSFTEARKYVLSCWLTIIHTISGRTIGLARASPLPATSFLLRLTCFCFTISSDTLRKRNHNEAHTVIRTSSSLSARLTDQKGQERSLRRHVLRQWLVYVPRSQTHKTSVETFSFSEHLFFAQLYVCAGSL